MTQISDVLRLGNAGMAPDTRQTPGTLNGKPGVATVPMNYYSITPATATTTSLVATSATGTTFTLAAGIGVTATTISTSTGVVTAYDLGCQRAITVAGITGVTTATFTINGWDDYKVPLTATFTGPSGNTNVTTTKTFRYVRNITTDTSTTSGVTIGTADTFGFPVRVDNFGDVRLTFGDTGITAVTGFTAAVATDPATATTGDVRGTYATQAASNGARKLIALIAVPTADEDQTVTEAYGVAQYSAI